MNQNTKSHILAMVQEYINEISKEKKAMLASLTINLEYAVNNDSLSNVFFYDILYTAISLLPEYIESDKDGSFVAFLEKEIEYLTQSVLCANFSKLSKSDLVKLDTKSSLAEFYSNILQEISFE